MDDCYSKNVCNCVSDPNCTKPQGHECCSEIPPNGKPKFGLWVKSGTCDNKKGLCKSKYNNQKLPDHKERFQILTREGYNDNNCNSWKNSFWIVWALLILSLFFVISKMIK
jgi:hypothetical protein